MTPLHGVLLTCWGDMGYPCFITGNDVCEKLITILLVALQKGKCRSHTFRFTFWGKIFWNPSGTEFPKMQIFGHNLVHSCPCHIQENFGQIRDDEASVFVDFHLNLLYEIGSHDTGATAAFVIVHIISTTFKLPTPSSNHTVTHRSFSIDLTHLPVNIGWLDIPGL